MKIYLSGGITNVQDYEKIFLEAQDYYRSEGFEVINPIVIGSFIKYSKKNPTWNDYMKLDISYLMTCDAIAMLPNWEESKGAKLEKYIANELNMKIYYYEKRKISR